MAYCNLYVCSAFDLEDKVVGTVGAGRIGQRVLKRLAVSVECAIFCCALCLLMLLVLDQVNV